MNSEIRVCLLGLIVALFSVEDTGIQGIRKADVVAADRDSGKVAVVDRIVPELVELAGVDVGNSSAGAGDKVKEVIGITTRQDCAVVQLVGKRTLPALAPAAAAEVVGSSAGPGQERVSKCHPSALNKSLAVDGRTANATVQRETERRMMPLVTLRGFRSWLDRADQLQSERREL